jgi:hypothetical protein
MKPVYAVLCSFCDEVGRQLVVGHVSRKLRDKKNA